MNEDDIKNNPSDTKTPPLKAQKNKTKPKLHGAKKSSFNPEMQTILQHEAHKMRIVKLILLLFGIFAAAGIATSLTAYIKSQSEKAEAMAKAETVLDGMANAVSNTATPIYEREKTALALMRKAVSYQNTYGEKAAEKANGYKKEAARVINASFYRNTETNSFRPFTPGGAELDMMFIPAGKFKRGASNAKLDLGWVNDRPQTEITINEPFWIGTKEIDTYQMRKLVPMYQMKDWRGYRLDTPSRPAGRVSWTEAAAYCKALTAIEKKAGRVPPGYEYRLPTEAEWEYACRAGTDTVYYWGDDFTEGAKYANSLDRRAANAMNLDVEDQVNVLKTDGFIISAPTGSLTPNAWGLYDMAGNNAEWCYDWFSPNAYRDDSLGTVSPVNLKPEAVDFERKRLGNSSTFTEQIPCRVVRGGSWGNIPENLRSAARDCMPPNTSNNSVGFRVVLAPIIK